MNNATYGIAAIVILDLKLIEIVDQSLSNMCIMIDNNSAVIVVLNPSRFFWEEKKEPPLPHYAEQVKKKEFMKGSKTALGVSDDKL